MAGENRKDKKREELKWLCDRTVTGGIFYMAKRFHDTEIWQQDWFLDVSYEFMMLWFYILDTCNYAGIWKPNKKLIEFITTKKVDLERHCRCLIEIKTESEY